jgi:predicted RNase H-like nuclease (RuvC/YqgF family)
MVLQMKVSPMEQIKKVKMIRPTEWEDTHLEAHKNINAAISQFYGLFDELVKEIDSISKKYEDAEEKSFASFSKLEKEIKWLEKEVKELNKNIEDINSKLREGRKFLTRRYEWIVDTDSETVVGLETITDDDLKWKQYLANIVVNEASPNQWTIEYTFPKTSLVSWEYTPRITLKAKEWEHAVLEYDFTIILIEV